MAKNTRPTRVPDASNVARTPGVFDQLADAFGLGFTVTSGAACEVYSTFEMICPLCHVVVPAKTRHRCGIVKEG